ncbi:MAG TPA: sigma-70 family RNA polymerase sigma factor [Vicinamibacterales bacterium]|nr:sigma-70 family RNA polymerase sigma factor [Vicinamibacterales bacterium]
MSIEQLFGDHRRFLWSLGYRMTGSAADADDVVQDTFVRMMEHPPKRTDEPVRPWLVKVALNRSRDLLRKRKRREYVGPWVPAPIETDEDAAVPSHELAPDRYDLLESVSLAFLVALEELTPTQRAVLLLRDVFDYSIAETADALDLTEPNVKITHHRARKAMDAYNQARVPPTKQVQDASRNTLFEFMRRLEAQDVAGVEALLASDVKAMTDGGGEFRSALRTIAGREKVARFFLSVSQIGKGISVRPMMLNGLPAVLVEVASAPERVARRTIMQMQLDANGRVAQIYVISATPKLAVLDHPTRA